MATSNKVITHSRFTEYDIFLFKSGNHYKLYEKLGSHPIKVDGKKGIYFAVFAPAAEGVSVVGNFNEWNGKDHNLFVRWDESGIWEGFIPGLKKGELYKYHIKAKGVKDILEKADPFAHFNEVRPQKASIAWDAQYQWGDQKWMQTRSAKNSIHAPMSVYEMHIASWKWHEKENRPLSYRELAPVLVEYLTDMQFTHVEFMPVMEHPYDPSWGYQITGYFAPTSRFGAPEDFKFLIDQLHQAGIGVILDWVPSHFPEDAHGLAKFDGSCVYEHPDPRKGYHPDWSSAIFNYSRPEIQSFLISNAMYWLDHYHIDGLRVDAVASIIYLDYSRDEGQWEPNIHGGNEYLEAIEFLKEFNRAVYAEYPDIMTIAEESTSFAGVTHPVDKGGLGFGFKWMMGWMHDTLKYFKQDSLFRSHDHGTITFSIYYAFSENFVLALSHDEVVHGKSSLLGRMPGDEWTRFANLRLMYAYMFMHPGGKLLFMGGEFAQYQEWGFERQLDWNLLDYPVHQNIHRLVADLNKFYQNEPALYELGYDPDGFEWIDFTDYQNSVISFFRKGKSKKDNLIIICNFTPVVREKYLIGVPDKGNWKTVFNTDTIKYGGKEVTSATSFKTRKKSVHNKDYCLQVDLPPLSMLALKKATRR